MEKLELTLNKLNRSVIKYNVEYYLPGQTKIGYIGFWITHDGVIPLDNKI